MELGPFYTNTGSCPLKHTVNLLQLINVEFAEIGRSIMVNLAEICTKMITNGQLSRITKLRVKSKEIK